MALNLYMNDARYITGAATSPAAPASGDPVVLGLIPGVALTGEGEGGNATGEVTIDTGGAYNLPIVGAITKGAIVYLITADGTLTATVGTNVRFGYALAAGTDEVIPIKIGY